MKSRRLKHAPGERFIMLPTRLLTHQRWITLPAAARVIFIDLSKRHHHGGERGPSNNGHIGYGCRAGAKAAKVSVGTAARMIAELRECALLRLRKDGLFSTKDRPAQTREWEIAIFPMSGRASKEWPSGGRALHIEHMLLNSPAYLDLSNAGKCVLIELMRRHDGGNNGNISFGGRGGHHIGFSTDITDAALTGIEAAGFIVQTAAAIPHLGHPRKWRLTMYKAEGKPATKDFMRITKAAPENPSHRLTGTVDTPPSVSVMRLSPEPASGDFANLAAPKSENAKPSKEIVPMEDTRTSETLKTRDTRTSETHLEASPRPRRFTSLVRALRTSHARPAPSLPQTPSSERLENLGEIANLTGEAHIPENRATKARTKGGRR